MLPSEYLTAESTMDRCTSSPSSSFRSNSSGQSIHINIYHSDKNENDTCGDLAKTQPSITITSKPTNLRPNFKRKLASRLQDTLCSLCCSSTPSSDPQYHETTPLLPKLKPKHTPTTSSTTVPFRNIYDYSQGPRPLKPAAAIEKSKLLLPVRDFAKLGTLYGVEVV